ncbi:mannose 6-phosphate receptor domain-containing protein [Marasmius fiardii PR-910]|nr:mannose 6-phosphate receptor domain-containing protein [Marasmius fiardii PR-910]
MALFHYYPSHSRLLLHFLFVAIFVSITNALPTENPCTIHDPSTNDYYDLNPLKSNTDYKFTTPGGHDFYINVCRGVATDLWGLDDPEIGAFIRRDHGDFSVGLSNTSLLISEGIPKMRMGQGSKCVSSTGTETGDLAETVVEFQCDRGVFGIGQPRLRAQIPMEDERACAFFVEWRTHFACPTGERSGPWGFFTFLIVICLIILMLYLLFGTLYNRYVLRLRGFDQIPQFSVEAFKYHAFEALDWFKDFMSKGYEGTQRGTTNPVSHQAGVDVGAGFSRDSGGAAQSPGVERGFVRPGAQRPSTNPVSHHTNANVDSASNINPVTVSQSVPPFSPPLPAKKKDKDTGLATTEERAFMLGDADEDEDDLGVGSPTPNPKGNSTVPTQTTPALDTVQAQDQTTQGKGHGEGGIRL